ncbi:MAG: hypothetical protein V1704_01130 [Candidatus Vogelbacteria bacterium]
MKTKPKHWVAGIRVVLFLGLCLIPVPALGQRPTETKPETRITTERVVPAKTISWSGQALFVETPDGEIIITAGNPDRIDAVVLDRRLTKAELDWRADNQTELVYANGVAVIIYEWGTRTWAWAINDNATGEVFIGKVVRPAMPDFGAESDYLADVRTFFDYLASDDVADVGISDGEPVGVAIHCPMGFDCCSAGVCVAACERPFRTAYCTNGPNGCLARCVAVCI